MLNPHDTIRITDERSLRGAYDAYYTRMCFYARRFLADSDAVEDVVQDIFVAMWTRTMRFDTPTAMRSFLYTSVYNACMNIMRSEAAHRRHGEAVADRYADGEMDYVNSRIEDEVLREVYEAIGRLPEECRRIFKLSYIENLSIEQVAEALNISPHTVESQRARAKQLLRDKLKYLYLFICLCS